MLVTLMFELYAGPIVVYENPDHYITSRMKHSKIFEYDKLPKVT